MDKDENGLGVVVMIGLYTVKFTVHALLDSMVVNFVTKFPRGVLWYWYWNWNWFWIWFLKIYADGPLQKVFLSISTNIHAGQFQGRE